jgi:ketosteroid isomerase-like protein
MAERPIQVVRQAIDAWARDLDGFLAFFAPDCEVMFRPDVPEPGPFHGRDQLRGWAMGFRQAWESQELEILELTASGDDVFVLLRLISHGVGSGIDTDEAFPFVFTVRDGLITRWRGFVEVDEARAAAGLAE